MTDASNHDRLLVQAVKRWAAKLLDTTGNNRLIYYRELKQGTLNLKDCDPEVLEDLYSGKRVLISELLNYGQAPPEEIDESEGLTYEEKRSQHHERVNKKAKAVYSKWRVYKEEKGISILFLAKDFLTWPKDPDKQSVPNAPIFLAELEIKPEGSGQSDFSIIKVGDWTLNETLLAFLDSKHSTKFSNNENLTKNVNHRDPQRVLSEINRRINGTNFSSDMGCVIGNFTYLKFPMVRDLEENIDLLGQHDLVSAIAGDLQAVSKISSDNQSNLPGISDPNFTPLADEFLVLDADSSQNYVINSAINNKSLIVEGPPGTGKSQTIANLITCLTAREKTVLFVAEKRAAIDAVATRLQNVGLSEIFYDLHAKEIKSKNVISDLSSSIDKLNDAGVSDYQNMHSDIESKRKELLDYSEAVHKKREPWDKSVFDVNTELLLHKTDNMIRFDSDQAEQLTESRISQTKNVLEKWVRSRRSMSWDSMWAGLDIPNTSAAKDYISKIESLNYKLLKDLTAFVQSLEGNFEQDLEELSLNDFRSLYELSISVKGVEETFSPDLWDENLNDLYERLEKQFFSADNRAARSCLKPLKKERLFQPKKQTKLIESAASIANEWNKFELGVNPNELWANDELNELLNEIDRTDEALKFILENFSNRPLSDLLYDASRACEEEGTAIVKGQISEFRETLKALEVEELLTMVENGTIGEEEAEKVFLYSVYKAIERNINRDEPIINTFQSARHNGVVKAFMEGDEKHHETSVNRLLRKIGERWRAAANSNEEQSALIKRELNKRSRHKSFRALQEEASDVLLALKPCWMMSPLTVSQSLPAKKIFDFVIFDEASQIRPEDAIASIARGHNTIIAGDRRQLPPSMFFDSGEDFEEEEDTDEALIEGYESILDVSSALLPQRMLTWHYRSRDERLIALSNAHIYGNTLTTFPGNMKFSPIQWHYVDYTPTSSTQTSFVTNPSEVDKVVELVIEHAKLQPVIDFESDEDELQHELDLESLGVIAFGTRHANAIQDALDKRLQELQDKDIDAFFDPERKEPFFVKNIERVQGDERDSIILSIGYGRDQTGKAPHRFGPVNQEGGERRLNVAASRARSKMAIVSSIKDTDIRNDVNAKGTKLLKNLLTFAESRGATLGLSEDATPLNPFELQVKYELEQIGLEPITQYGVAGYKIDFVIPNPNDPNDLRLAVEADGASYHSSPTARDRDRLRQRVLEDKGWRFYRIWSTNFFRNPRGEALLVKEALSRAINNEVDIVDTENLNIDSPTPRASAIRQEPNLPYKESIDQHDMQQLVALVRWITEDGKKLINDSEIKKVMISKLGYNRLGPLIDRYCSNAIKRARGEKVDPLPKKNTRTSSAQSNSGTQKKCSCGGTWVRRNGTYGTFWGCSNYFSTGCTNKRPKSSNLKKSSTSQRRSTKSSSPNTSGKLSEAEAAAPMIAAGLTPLEEYRGHREQWLCECNVCGRQVRIRRESINKRKSQNKGCEDCIK